MREKVIYSCRELNDITISHCRIIEKTRCLDSEGPISSSYLSVSTQFEITGERDVVFRLYNGYSWFNCIISLSGIFLCHLRTNLKAPRSGRTAVVLEWRYKLIQSSYSVILWSPDLWWFAGEGSHYEEHRSSYRVDCQVELPYYVRREGEEAGGWGVLWEVLWLLDRWLRRCGMLLLGGEGWMELRWPALKLIHRIIQ